MSQSYTLRIAVDDSKLKELEKRLQKLLGVSGAATGTDTKSAAKGGGLFGNSGIAKNILKLGTIAVGIAGILSVVKKIADMSVEASPVLQSMLKLLNTGIMFILRPIGDFIGFFLRPILIFFLRNIALPLYRTWGPIMRKMGTDLGILVGSGLGGAGKNLVSNLTFEPLPGDPLFGTDGFFTKLPERFAMWQTQLNAVELPNFGEIMTNSIIPSILNIGSLFTVLANEFVKMANIHMLPSINGISGIFTELLSAFVNVFNTNILPVVNGIAGFFQVILNDLTGRVSTIWTDIVNFFTELAEKLTGLPQLIWDSLTNFITGGGNNSGGNNVTNNNNFMIDINANGIDDLEEAKNGLAGMFNELLQGK